MRTRFIGRKGKYFAPLRATACPAERLERFEEFREMKRVSPRAGNEKGQDLNIEYFLPVVRSKMPR